VCAVVAIRRDAAGFKLRGKGVLKRGGASRAREAAESGGGDGWRRKEAGGRTAAKATTGPNHCVEMGDCAWAHRIFLRYSLTLRASQRQLRVFIFVFSLSDRQTKGWFSLDD
jgi:hypothetical protein